MLFAKVHTNEDIVDRTKKITDKSTKTQNLEIVFFVVRTLVMFGRTTLWSQKYYVTTGIVAHSLSRFKH